MDLEAIKTRMSELIESQADRLIEISHSIHSHPETNFEERFAHDLLCDVLEGEGITTERKAHGMDTAFVGRAGSSGPNIGVCLEYDALPEIGHGCGHNIIASAGLGAGLAAAAVAAECGGQVTILGTPAEEGGGGKIFMIRDGAFKDVDAAVMVHPAGAELRSIDAIAVHTCFATYHGRAAHAAAAPEQGRNALDAAVLGYINVAALRQHILPGERLHGTFTDGGAKPNVVPARAETHWFVRSPTTAGLDALKQRFITCIEAGAAAAGCTVEISWVDPPFSDLITNTVLADAYAANAARQGRVVEDPAITGTTVVGSTDMGDVSHVVPAIHPVIQAAETGTAIHTEDFAVAANSPSGDQAVLDGAKIMAWTIADLWLRPDLLAAAKDEFAASSQASSGVTGSPAPTS